MRSVSCKQFQPSAAGGSIVSNSSGSAQAATAVGRGGRSTIAGKRHGSCTKERAGEHLDDALQEGHLAQVRGGHPARLGQPFAGEQPQAVQLCCQPGLHMRRLGHQEAAAAAASAAVTQEHKPASTAGQPADTAVTGRGLQSIGAQNSCCAGTADRWGPLTGPG